PGLAAVADAGDLALDAARAEAAGHDHAIEALEAFGDVRAVDAAGLDPALLDAAVEPGGAVLDGLLDGGVRVAQLGVLAGDADGDGALPVGAEARDEPPPAGPRLVLVPGVDAVVQAKDGEDLAVEPLGPELVRDRV